MVLDLFVGLGRKEAIAQCLIDDRTVQIWEISCSKLYASGFYIASPPGGDRPLNLKKSEVLELSPYSDLHSSQDFANNFKKIITTPPHQIRTVVDRSPRLIFYEV